MTLGAPLALLGLLLVPILFLLERLRRRPQEVVVASLDLWRDVETPVRRPSSRRRNLRLILRLVAVTALVFAATAPAVTTEREVARRLYALVDRSPSMGADDRLERAMDVVRSAADRFEEVRVLFVPPAEVLREGSSLATPDPAPAAGRTEEALMSLADLAAGEPSCAVLFVGDRAPEVSPGATVALVGRPVPNGAVTALCVEEDTEGLAVFVAWRRFGGDGVAPGLVLSVDGTDRPVLAGGAGPREAVVRIDGGATRVEARLARTPDALAADDTALAVAGPAAGVRGLLGDPPATIAAALRALLGDRLVEGVIGPGGGVAYRVLPPADAPGPWIVIRPPGPWRGFVPGESPGLDPVRIEDLTIAPALAAAFPPDLPAGIRIGPPISLESPDDAEVLLRSREDGRPLLVASADRRSAVLAFDPADEAGNFDAVGSHAVLWRTLLDHTAGFGRRFASDGILDETESDLAGEERPLPPAFGSDLPTHRTASTRSLRAPAAALGLVALIVLLAPSLFRRRTS